MTALEQVERQLKHPSFTAVEREFLSAFWHWAGGVEPLLIIAVFQCFPTNDNPGPAAGTGHARAQNPIHDSEIIRVLAGLGCSSPGLQLIRRTRHTTRTQHSVKPGKLWILLRSDIHVSLLSRKNTRGQARSRERALFWSRSLARAFGASRLWSLRSQNRTSICCLGPVRAFAED
jgi:hypothetical protein